MQQLVERTFTCRRDSLEELLVEWLGCLVYVFDTEHIVFSGFSVEKLDDGVLVAHAMGEFYDADRHGMKTLIKAVTYHELSVRSTAAGFEADIIFDI